VIESQTDLPSFLSVFGLLLKSAPQMKLPVMHKMLIGHNFGENFWPLPGIRRVMIFASFPGAWN
jgi:hypothetical protein